MTGEASGESVAPIEVCEAWRSTRRPRLAYPADSAEQACAWRQELRAALRRVSGLDAMASWRCEPGFEIDRVETAMDTVRRAYDVEGARDRLTFDVHEYGHRWGGTTVWPWLAQWMKEG
jgi:hypothetical protein